MKEYPKILGPYDAPWGEDCIAFDKLDGSNLRFEWNQKQGWYKFGTRRHLFDRTCPEYGPAVDIFIKKYGEGIEQVIRNHYRKCDSVIAYAEYFGPYTLGGKQDDGWLKDAGLLPEGKTNSPKDVVLFDVNPHKQCFISPRQFVDYFGHLQIPKIIYEGELTESFANDVREGKYPVIEGVVVKGNEKHKLWMRKIKTFSYLKKIKEVFGTGWEEFGE